MTRHGTAEIEVDHGLHIPLIDATKNKLYDKDATSIQASPYQEAPHVLNLTRVELPYQLIALALRSFTNIVNDYATHQYSTTFNFDQVLALIRGYQQQADIIFPQTKCYIVAFRSQLKEEIQSSAWHREQLADIDSGSHQEATDSGGLLKYWFGVPNEADGKNLATCIWRSKQDAILGGGRKIHREGMKRVRGWYAEWHIEQYEWVIETGAESYSFVPLN